MVVRWYHTWILEGHRTPRTLSVIQAPGPPHWAEISRVEVRNRAANREGGFYNWSTCILREIFLAKQDMKRSSNYND